MAFVHDAPAPDPGIETQQALLLGITQFGNVGKDTFLIFLFAARSQRFLQEFPLLRVSAAW